MKCFPVFELFLILALHTACGQNQTNVPKDNGRAGYSESQLKEADTSKVPMSMVRNVKQARNGDILIASYLGVFRYNETSFTNISSEISSPSFWDVLEDRKGNLWFATRDSGVYHLPAGETRFQHFTTMDGLASNTVLHIYEDRAGNIWFATEGGASRYDGKSFRNFTTNDGLLKNEIVCIYEDKAGNIWFGVSGGASRYNVKSLQNYIIQRDSIIEDRTGKTFPNIPRRPNGVSSIIEDKTGKFWFGTNGNAFVYDAGLPDGKGKVFTTLTHAGKPFRNVRSIIEDQKGNIWLGGKDGLWRYDTGNGFTNITRISLGISTRIKKETFGLVQ